MFSFQVLFYFKNVQTVQATVQLLYTRGGEITDHKQAA